MAVNTEAIPYLRYLAFDEQGKGVVFDAVSSAICDSVLLRSPAVGHPLERANASVVWSFPLAGCRGEGLLAEQ